MSADQQYSQEELRGFFREYEGLKLENKRNDKRMDELKKILIDYVPEDKAIELSFGVLVRMPGKPSYDYSPGLTAEIERINGLKEEEVRTGAAKVKYGKPFIQYNENKEEKEAV